MQATIAASPPGLGGCDLSVDAIRSVLKASNVVEGIDESHLAEFVDNPVYNESVVMAEGIPAQDGKDAAILYDFETDASKLRLREAANGRIDFREANQIQNVVQGQPLAKKIAAENGKPGFTVSGKALPSKNGKDISMPVGKNVHVASDGITIIADLNGQVLLVGGKINVEPVYNVSGNVNMNTGNIIFLGTVIISGNVEDGFSVKAEGNIEVKGNVGKAELEAEGDIIVNQGVTGKETGSIKAGKSVFAKFIENANVESGDSVVVSDGLVNANVTAMKRIICNGKRAHIVGGRLRATEEINAKSIGSPGGGSETVCEVGFDPQRKAQMEKLIADNEAAQTELEQIKLNLQTIINMKKQRKSLPEDKEMQLNELMDRRDELTSSLKQYKEERQEIQNYLDSLKTLGRVSASERVYPGVRVIIREVEYPVKDEYRSVSFILRDNLVQASRYEEVSEKVLGSLRGNTTN
jgi:uncharacterized protein (DUF342 family)